LQAIAGMAETDLLGLNEWYYAGDHWQSWIGPRIKADSAGGLEVMQEVERVFQEANKVKECVDRHRRALTAKPAAWSLLSNGEALDDEAIESFIKMQWGWMLPRSGREREVANYDTRRWQDPRSLVNQQESKYNGPLSCPNAIAEAMHNRLLGGKGYLRLW
jgi:hypothetical protein